MIVDFSTYFGQMRSLDLPFQASGSLSLVLAAVAFWAADVSIIDDVFLFIAAMALAQLAATCVAWFLARAERWEPSIAVGAVAVALSAGMAMLFSMWFALPAVVLAIGLSRVRNARRARLLEVQGLDAAELPDWSS